MACPVCHQRIGSGPVVTANARQLEQVLAQLVTRAWESVAAGLRSAVGLTVSTVPAADIPATYGCLGVRDSGCDEEEVMAGVHPEQPLAFLGKPFGFAALKNAIGRALAGTGE